MKRAAITLSFLAIIAATHVHAQSEHVPVGDPVYAFFDLMHVRGVLPEYSRTVLPLAWKDVARFLEIVERHRTELSETEISLLEKYTRIFIDELRGTQRSVDLFGGQSVAASIDGVFSNAEKHLYSYRDSATSMYIDLVGRGDYRTRFAGGAASNVFLGHVGGRFRGTAMRFFGYGLESTNGTDIGSKELAMMDRSLRQNKNFSDYSKKFFDFTQAYLSANFDWIAVTLGNERMTIGSGAGTQLVASANAPVYDALRVDVRYKSLRYLFAHTAILSQRQQQQNGQPYYDPKFFVVHRAEADLFDAVRFGVFETVIYARRFLDLAYLNPINFYKSAEHASGDRDNPMLGFDLQSISLPSMQLYGTWMIDDVDFSKLNSQWWGNKFAWQGGLVISPQRATELTIEYTRIEPYVYSHFYAVNAYTHNDYVIGSETPPNSDRWHVRMRRWIGADLLATLAFDRIRHGANIVGSDGALIRNVGGDAISGFRMGRDNETAPFLDGERETQTSVALTLRYEPYRNIVLDFFYRFSNDEIASRSSSSHFLSAVLSLDF